MNKILLVIVFLLAPCFTSLVVAGERVITLEIGVSLGKSKAYPIVSARYRDGHTEAHAGRWFGENPSSVLGVGFVKETKRGKPSKAGSYTSYSSGLAYIVNPNPKSMAGHTQLFHRVAFGDNKSAKGDLEVVFTNYGLPFYNKGEQFLSVATKYSDRKDPVQYPKSLGSPSTPGEECEGLGEEDQPPGDFNPGPSENPHQGDEDKPGYGYGDDNHNHSGPPGHS